MKKKYRNTKQIIIGIQSEVQSLSEKDSMSEIEEMIRKSVITALEPYRIKACEVSVLLTDNEKIRELNREHRNKDAATDVLSFPQYPSLKEVKAISFPYLGDIVISIETAREQACEFGHSLRREISYLTVHSVLHLLGYDHLEEKDRFMMRHAEKEIMKRMGVFKEL